MIKLAFNHRFTIIKLAIGIIVTSFAFGIAVDTKNQHEPQFAHRDDWSWLKEYMRKFEELNWFADSQVQVTQENTHKKVGNSPALFLFNQPYIEFDRTILSLKCLHIFLEGKYEDYLELTLHQPEHLRLSWQSFQALQNHGKNLIASCPSLDENEMKTLLESALILGDTGKIASVRKKVKDLGEFSHDHDEFYSEIIRKKPEIFPSYNKLPEKAKKLLVASSGLIHFGHVTHIEGGLNMFMNLQKSKILVKEPLAFEIAFFLHQCDVAGALGHVDPMSSIVYNENVHKSLTAVKKACLMLKDHSPSKAFDEYLSQRAAWLGLDAQSPLHRTLARIGAMLRLYTPEEGKILKEAFLKLSPEKLSMIVEELNTLDQDSEGAVPTYVPAVLVNLAGNHELGETKTQRLTESIHIGLPFICCVLKEHKLLVQDGKIDKKIALNFNLIAKVAKESPASLKDLKFCIESNGDVIAQS